MVQKEVCELEYSYFDRQSERGGDRPRREKLME